jgi:tripartite-type tricarboxylate transporter receptor subunit TctC
MFISKLTHHRYLAVDASAKVAPGRASRQVNALGKGRGIKVHLKTVRVVLATVFAFAASQAWAQTYPDRPVRIVVPFPAASATDVLARTIGQKLGERWHQPVVIDNRPGAGGNLGTELAAKAPADGYTILMGTVANAISTTLYKKLNYNFVKDFDPVTLVATTPLVLVANPKFPGNSVKDVINYAKSKPGELNFSSGGTGTSNHLAGEMLKSMTGINMVHVPYKGTPAAYSDLLAGQVSLMFDNIVAVMPHIKAGSLKPIAVTSAKRVPSLPEVPTVSESGVPGFDAVSWIGALVPAGTPKDIIAKLNTDMVAVLNMPDVKERLAASGAELKPSTPEQLAEHIRTEIDKWGKAVKSSGAQAE